MSMSTYVTAVSLAFAALLTGCAAGTDAARSAPASGLAPSPHPSQWPCLNGMHATVIGVPGTSPVLNLAVVGSGDRAVVFSDESDADLCSWLPYARMLAGDGLRVVLYDYALGPRDDLAHVTGYLRAQGTHAIALVGASEGAKASIVAGTSQRVQAVVSLSAEDALSGLPVAPYARRLAVPTLYVSAADDPYGAASATRAFYKLAPATAKQLVIVPGTAHGTALLARPALARDVTAFIQRHDR
jgi:pimeloyl-ACP methyl ester carboxylesterase